MAFDSFEKWEEDFIALCEERLEEEPFYPYEHLWRKKYSLEKAFETYLKENEDYAEKYYELSGELIGDEMEEDETVQLNFLKMAKDLENKRRLKNDKEKIAMAEKQSKYCPECGRNLDKKKRCRCGYSRK
jgi:putative hemolysin